MCYFISIKDWRQTNKMWIFQFNATYIFLQLDYIKKVIRKVKSYLDNLCKLY